MLRAIQPLTDILVFILPDQHSMARPHVLNPVAVILIPIRPYEDPPAMLHTVFETTLVRQAGAPWSVPSRRKEIVNNIIITPDFYKQYSNDTIEY
jgi:hypothetical protein